MSDPFARRATPLPVLVVLRAEAMPAPRGEDARIVLPAAAHAHEPGQACAACAALGDVRAHLFELGERIRLGAVAAPARVIVDASRVADPGPVIATLSGALPATALRDHTVARNFRLDGVVGGEV